MRRASCDVGPAVEAPSVLAAFVFWDVVPAAGVEAAAAVVVAAGAADEAAGWDVVAGVAAPNRPPEGFAWVDAASLFPNSDDVAGAPEAGVSVLLPKRPPEAGAVVAAGAADVVAEVVVAADEVAVDVVAAAPNKPPPLEAAGADVVGVEVAAGFAPNKPPAAGAAGCEAGVEDCWVLPNRPPPELGCGVELAPPKRPEGLD